MDDRQVNSQAHQRRCRDVNPLDHGLSQGLHMVGWREDQMLVAGGHYRCPECRRADTMEVNAVVASRPRDLQ